MLYSYAGFPEHSWAIVERNIITEACADGSEAPAENPVDDKTGPASHTAQTETSAIQETPRSIKSEYEIANVDVDTKAVDIEKVDGKFPDVVDSLEASTRDARMARDAQVKKNTMSSLSIALTSMSIVVAFRSVHIH